MKATLQKNYRQLYTLEDLDRAKMVIEHEKEDEETAKGWAAYAVREALKGKDDYLTEVIKATAETAKNFRAWNEYGEGTEDMDIWIEATAETGHGFIKVGAYLSDIWQSGAVAYKHQMFIKYYKEA